MKRSHLIVAAFMVGLFLLGWSVGRGSSRDLYANLDVFVEVLKRVQDHYVDQVEPSAMIEGAVLDRPDEKAAPRTFVGGVGQRERLRHFPAPPDQCAAAFVGIGLTPVRADRIEHRFVERHGH